MVNVMKNLNKWIFVLLFLAGITEGYHTETMADIYQSANIKFASKVYGKLTPKASDKQNFFFSPFSLQAALYFALIGASGKTAEEITDATEFPAYVPLLEIMQKYLFNNLRDNDITHLSQITVDSVNPRDTYIEEAKKAHADIETVNNYSTIPLEVNHWLALNTKGAIQQIRDRIDFIATNVISFSGKWKYPFKRSQHKFKSNVEKQEDGDMFVTDGEFFYIKDTHLDGEFVELPLVGENLALVIALPKKHNGICNFEKSIFDILQKQKHLVTKRHLRVHIPKYFPIQHNISFDQNLDSLGIRLATSDRAEFKKLSKTSLKIFSVLQKSIIEMCPKNFKASSVTTNTLRKKPRSLPVMDLIVDQPFVYYLKHSALGILVVGRFVMPDQRNRNSFDCA